MAMNGKRVKVEEEFELDGADGKNIFQCAQEIFVFQRLRL